MSGNSFESFDGMDDLYDFDQILDELHQKKNVSHNKEKLFLLVDQ